MADLYGWFVGEWWGHMNWLSIIIDKSGNCSQSTRRMQGRSQRLSTRQESLHRNTPRSRQSWKRAISKWPERPHKLHSNPMKPNVFHGLSPNFLGNCTNIVNFSYFRCYISPQLKLYWSSFHHLSAFLGRFFFLLEAFKKVMLELEAEASSDPSCLDELGPQHPRTSPDRSFPSSRPVPEQFPAPDHLGRPGIPGIRRMTSFPSTCYRRRPWFYGWWWMMMDDDGWWWMMMDEPKILWGVDFRGLGGIMPLGLLGGCCHQTSWGDHWWLWCLVDDRQIYIYILYI